MGKLYIAYGSNMNLAQMSTRCPNATVVGTAELNDSRLLFRGSHYTAVATIEPFDGGTVPVLVWKITPRCETALDYYEGFPNLYRKETVKISLNGVKTDVMVYIMNTLSPDGKIERTFGQPGKHYYASIKEGYKSAGFDIEILRQAVIDSIRQR